MIMFRELPMSPLMKKLNLTSQPTILVLKAPESFETELEGLDSVKVLRKATAKTEVAFAMVSPSLKLILMRFRNRSSSHVQAMR